MKFFSTKPLDSPFEIPIFPLRKTCRLPGEELTLNLYEPRYLEMAQYILKMKMSQPVFGAIYSSNKPQMIRHGDGPIVPMLQPEDIGTLFQVIDSEEGDIPTEGGDLRKRIRLMGVGIGRFRIRRILSKGLAGEEGIRNGDRDFPFILAEASLYGDSILSEGDIKRFSKTIELPSHTSDDDRPIYMTMEEQASFQFASQKLTDKQWSDRLDCLSITSTIERIENLSRKSIFSLFD